MSTQKNNRNDETEEEEVEKRKQQIFFCEFKYIKYHFYLVLVRKINSVFNFTFRYYEFNSFLVAFFLSCCFFTSNFHCLQTYSMNG